MSHSVCPGLLVSVRSAAEAEAALAGGADLIDVKEPSRGSLGRADDAVIEEVIRVVAGRRPVSAAMGDFDTLLPAFDRVGLAYLKWGLAQCDLYRGTAWREWIAPNLARQVAPLSSRAVLAAYADWGRAGAPPPESVLALVRDHGCGVLVLDTFTKDGSTLLDWMPRRQIAMLTRLCHNSGVRVALAGSLGAKEITALAHLKPDWFAVRGAACRGGKREGTVDADKVRELKGLIQASVEA